MYCFLKIYVFGAFGGCLSQTSVFNWKSMTSHRIKQIHKNNSDNKYPVLHCHTTPYIVIDNNIKQRNILNFFFLFLVTVNPPKQLRKRNVLIVIKQILHFYGQI